MRFLSALGRPLVLGALLLTALTAFTAAPAAARVFVGIGVGFPAVYAPYPYYPYYPYYYYPPAYYPPYYAAPAPAPAAAPAPAQAPAAQSWYYCDNPKGYYPYVQSCSAWRQVSATPPQ